MKLNEYKEKRMQDAEFASAYFECQSELDSIRNQVPTQEGKDDCLRTRIHEIEEGKTVLVEHDLIEE